MTGEPVTPGAVGWAGLRGLTAARIGLARSGASLGTVPLLEFRLAHARARDAVHARLDVGALREALRVALGEALGLGEVLEVSSRAVGRAEYLMRPDLGRGLDDASVAVLGPHAGEWDLVIVLGDGLSALAVQLHAAALLAALVVGLRAGGWRVAPLVVAVGARVALGDAVARALGARAVLMLIGERPGLSAPDSLGAYLTYAPAVGTTDAGRNCVSNIRPDGLGSAAAAHTVLHLLERMRALRMSGVGLKDHSGGVGSVGAAGVPTITNTATE